MECLLPSLWLMILFVLERPSLYGAAFALGSFHFCLTRHVHTYVLNNGDYQLLLWNMILFIVCANNTWIFLVSSKFHFPF